MKPVIASTYNSKTLIRETVGIDDNINVTITTEFGTSIIRQELYICVKKQMFVFYQPKQWIIYPFLYTNTGEGEWRIQEMVDFETIPTLNIKYDWKQQKWNNMEE